MRFALRRKLLSDFVDVFQRRQQSWLNLTLPKTFLQRIWQFKFWIQLTCFKTWMQYHVTYRANYFVLNGPFPASLFSSFQYS